MKKVKLLTFHNAENYGANLQAYALKETLKELNIDASFVNYLDENILKDYALIRRTSIKSFFSSFVNLKRNILRKKSFKTFCNKYLDGDTKKYYTKEQIEKDAKKGLIYISGSDQVFNPKLTKGLSDVYTLNFGKDITRIAYGASVGNDEMLTTYEKDFKEKLKNMDMISVREKSIAEKLSNITSKDVSTVVDPTLLLEKEKWDKLIEANDVYDLKDEKYILVYTLFENDEITKISNYLSEITGYKIIHFGKKGKFKNEIMTMYEKGPVDFVNTVKNAEYVITNSFHGLIFSIIFEKKFYTIMPKERAGRLRDLIDLTGLNGRTLEKLEDIKVKDINETIDFISAKENINEQRKISTEFLEKAINS